MHGGQFLPICPGSGECYCCSRFSPVVTDQQASGSVSSNLAPVASNLVSKRGPNKMIGVMPNLVGGSMAISTSGGGQLTPMMVEESVSDIGNSKLVHASTAKVTKEGTTRGKVTLSREYNLRNKVVSSSPAHDNTYIICTNVIQAHWL